jgi:hypothetical protein
VGQLNNIMAYQQQLLADLLRPNLLKKTNFANQLQTRPTWNQAVQGLPQPQSLTDLIVSNLNRRQQTASTPTSQQTTLLPPQELSRTRQAMMRGGGFLPTTEQQQAIAAGGFKTQADLDAYNKAQNAARFQGIGKLLMGVSDAFAGRNIGQEHQARETSAIAKTNQMIQMQEQERLRKQRLGLESTIDEMIKSGQISPAMGEYAKADPSFLGKMYELQKKTEIEGAKPTKGPTSYEEYIRTDDTPTDPEYAEFLENKTRQGATQINLPDTQARMGIEYAYEVLKGGDQRLIANQNVTDRLYLMDMLLDDPEFETGAMANAFLPIKSWLVEFGGKSDTYVENLGAQQLFDALSSYIVPRMRAIGSGATSDFEAGLYQKAIASLGKTKEANRLIIKFMLATTERDRKMLELQKRYVAEFDEILGFNAALRDETSGYVEAELFRKFDMEINEDTGATDFEQAIANGDIKEGDLYYDRKVKKMRIYGSEPIPDPF